MALKPIIAINSFKNILIGLFFTIYFGYSALAQNIHTGGIFPTIDHSGSITNKLDYSLYYFGAFPLVNFSETKLDETPFMLLFYGEQALNYNITNKLSFSASYVYQREKTGMDSYVNENRVHFQLTYKYAVNQVKFKHRLRFDNRFITDPNTDTNTYKNRLRYLLGMELPIGSDNNNWYFTSYEEAFFNTFKNANKVFAENWAYAAIGKRLNNNHKLEAGPLYITWFTGNNNWFNQYYLQLTWISNVDFRKKDVQFP